MKLIYLAILWCGILEMPLGAAENDPFRKPVQSVFDHYIKIQRALARDDAAHVQVHAARLVKEVRGDAQRVLPAELGDEAQVLAEATDLKSARAAFKPVSATLIHYLEQNRVPAAHYYEMYCPMVQAGWLQDTRKVANPYMGKTMPSCGTLERKNFSVPPKTAHKK